MGNARRVIIEFLGQDKSLSSTASKAEGRMSKLGGKMKDVGKIAAMGLAAGVAVAGVALFKMGQAAIEDEAGQKRLAKAMQNAAGASRGQIAATEDWITAQGKALGVADDELRPALEKLVGATHDVGEAQKLASLAMDVSAGSGKSLEAVSTAMTKAQNGNVGALSRLGISTKDAEGKVISFEEAQRRLAKLHKGQASTAANTTAGKFERLKLMMSEAGEEIGAKLIPIATKMADWFLAKGLPAITAFGDYMGEKIPPIIDKVRSAIDKVMEVLAPFGDWMKDNPQVVKVFAGVLGGLAVAIGIITVAMGLFSAVLATTGIPLLIIGVAALAAGLYYAYQKSETFRAVIAKVGSAFQYLMGEAKKLLPAIRSTFADAVSIAKSALAGLKVAFSVALNVIQGVWSKFGGNILQFLSSTLENVKTVLSGAFTVIRGIFKTVSSLLKGDWKGVWDGIKMILRGAVTALVGIVKQLGNLLRFAFKNIGTALKALMRGIWSGIKTIISNGAQGIVNAVKAIPGKLGALGRLFANAGKGLLQGFINGMKNAAGIITGIAGNVWDAVKRLLNGAIDKINGALEFKINVLGKDIGINPPNIPHLAKGGIVNKPTLALIGEDGPEAVVPLGAKNRPRGSMPVGDGGGGGNTIVNIYGALDPVAVGRQVEKVLIQYSRATNRPVQVKTL